MKTTSAVRFGLWTPLPHTIPPEARMEDAIARTKAPGGVGEPDGAFEFACEAVLAAEAAGFSITLIAERYDGPDLEALTLAAALAARTRTMELLVAAHPGVITPQIVAKMAMSIDRISGGRCAINLVNGWWAEEFELFSNGAKLDGEGERYRRMREYVDVFNGLTSGAPLDFKGRFYTARSSGLTMRPARGRIPIYAASRASEGKDVVAETCDLWFVDYAPDYRAFDANFERIRNDVADLKARASRFDREIECGVSCHVICAGDERQAIQRADALMEHGRKNRIAAVAAKGLGAGLVGSPDVIAARIRAYQSIGVTCFMLHFHPMMEGLRTFIDRVMPLVQPATAPA